MTWRTQRVVDGLRRHAEADGVTWEYTAVGPAADRAAAQLAELATAGELVYVPPPSPPPSVPADLAPVRAALAARELGLESLGAFYWKIIPIAEATPVAIRSSRPEVNPGRADLVARGPSRPAAFSAPARPSCQAREPHPWRPRRASSSSPAAGSAPASSACKSSKSESGRDRGRYQSKGSV